ncbi:DUF6270 domain-containing protein [Glutamicibacter ardleyensis]|uniref:DUF6270 domain-containing protein n=1 Tax=Glutamicibacter ardleyensis TaxID=225894 RepID=UPI003F8FB354
MAKLFIYGGCVSRDSFELIKNENKIVQYVARQSLISAASKPEKRFPLNALSDNFNSRMVKGDIQSSLLRSITRYSEEVDHLLFDILSERLGVYRFSGGTYITNSAELQKSGLLQNSAIAKTLIRMGTDRHFELWKKSVESFHRTLSESKLINKTSLIKVNWTDETIQKTPVPLFRNWSASDANKLYARYYSHLENNGFNIIEPPAEVSLSDLDHKWGASPYHFQDEYYEYITSQLKKLI